jgi:hypothetical protein
MRFARILVLVAALCSIAVPPAAAREPGADAGAVAHAPTGQTGPPIRPFNPYGTVTVNGLAAEAGTVVGGWCGGTLWDTFPAELVAGEAWYSLEIPGDDPDTSAIVEGCGSGETVSFTIDGVPAPQTATWVDGATRVDLTTTFGVEVNKQISGDGVTWHDADTSPTYPEFAEETDLTWRIGITNTGSVTVSLAVTDTLDGVPLALTDACASAPPTILPPAGTPGASYACEIADSATLGSHRNVVTATVVYDASAATAFDAAGYVGTEDAWEIYLPLILR